MGYWFCFSRSKQRNKLEQTTICVPRRQKDWLPCVEDSGRKAVDYDPASVIDTYLEAVMQDLSCKREELSGCFFKGTHGKSGKRFIKANIGKNTLACVGVEIASELCLRSPETYTGHCWRRSAGTNASNSGVNVTTLMSMMGWSCPKTAMQYVQRSRLTSLKMSMYLANVQRRNCPDPFPSGNRVSRKTKFQSVKKDTAVRTFSVVEKAETGQDQAPEIENIQVDFRSQEILSEQNVVCEESVNLLDHVNVSDLPISRKDNCNEVVENSSTSVLSSSVDLSSIDSRLVNILHNLQNHGTVNINLNFGDLKK